MKQETYSTLITQVRTIIEGERDEISVMANAAALIHSALGHHWTGFYIVRENSMTGKEELCLGPFQGSAACYRIGYGKGVCRTAWARGETVVVEDVDAFPGHIACSSLSRSEIVVPVCRKEKVAADLDIDSATLGSFDSTDRTCLEEICRILSESIYPD